MTTSLKKEVMNKNPLVLAFLGDAVMTLHIRQALINQGSAAKISHLHTQASKLVCAKAQAEHFDTVSQTFDTDEEDISRRSRNAQHNTVPKNCTLADYKKATALEAVIGYNFLVGNLQRVQFLCTLSKGDD